MAVILASATANSALANCRTFMSEKPNEQAETMRYFETYVAGWIHGFQVSCSMADAEMKKRGAQVIEYLSASDCAGRERGIRFSRLPIEERASLVMRVCLNNPETSVDRALSQVIADLR